MASAQVWLLAALVAGAPTKPPAITALSVAFADREILVSFAVEASLEGAFAERLESGLPTGFVYDLELLRDRKRWWDRALVTSRLEVVAMYNAVTRAYLVNTKHDGELIESRTLHDLGELRRALTRFSALPLFSLPDASSRERYLVRARVGLGVTQLLGFIPYTETGPWVESNKVRPLPRSAD